MLDHGSVSYGYFQKCKFTSDKKANWLELTTKDQRQFKIKFDSAEDYHKAINAITKNLQPKKYKALAAFDYAKACI
jgi:hypothetical protein